VRAAIPTPLGTFHALYSAAGLAELRFPGEDASITPEEVPQSWHADTTAAVQSILLGKAPRRLPPLDLRTHTAFRQQVWAELLRIPLGQTASYSEIAERLGNRGATRAVGGACGANPIPLIIPCHRVLAAGQRIGGFSGGISWKRKLLVLEGISFREASTPGKGIETPDLFPC
jgi:O-6-methylguanine DNA methyltransferase